MLDETQISDLTTALSLALAGRVSYKMQQEIVNTASAPPLRGLPMTTTLTLESLPLQEFLKVSLSCEFKTFKAAYAAYCTAVKLGETFAPVDFFQGRLGLSPADAKYLFRSRKHAKAENADSWKIFVGLPLAALVLWNFRCFIAQDDTKGFVVVSGGQEFGVRDGYLAGPAKPCDMPKAKLVPKAKLREAWAGVIRAPKSLFTDRAGKALKAVALSDSEKLALSILRHRATDAQARRVLSAGLKMPTSGKGLSALRAGLTRERALTLKGCQGYAEFPTPYQHLHEALVPGYVTADRFKGMFGKPPASAHFGRRPVAQWDQSLAKLRREGDAEQNAELA